MDAATVLSKPSECIPEAPIPRGNRLFCPFDIDIDPMQRLLLINFEKDPDAIYVGFEPQIFHDDLNGKGMLVIGWRRDGKIDIYYDYHLQLRPEKYDIAGKGLENQIPVDFTSSFFDVTERGVIAGIGFRDIEGRDVRLKIEETNPKKRKPFALLAPMGDAAENPSSLPLVLLHDFYFVRQKKSVICIEINGRKHRPDKLPFLMDGCKMYFTRYCPDPTIATINRAYEGLLPVIDISENTRFRERLHVNVNKQGSKNEISGIYRNYKDRRVSLHFKPAFPDLSCLQDDEVVNGSFRITEDPAVGMVKGYYLVENNSHEINITMIPSAGWIPREKKLSLRILYSIAGIFRNWPTTYRWTASIKTEEKEMFMKSKWERIKN